MGENSLDSRLSLPNDKEKKGESPGSRLGVEKVDRPT